MVFGWQQKCFRNTTLLLDSLQRWDLSSTLDHHSASSDVRLMDSWRRTSWNQSILQHVPCSSSTVQSNQLYQKPRIISRNRRNNMPCIAFMKKSANILSVGQYSICSFPLSILSITQNIEYLCTLMLVHMISDHSFQGEFLTGCPVTWYSLLGDLFQEHMKPNILWHVVTHPHYFGFGQTCRILFQ